MSPILTILVYLSFVKQVTATDNVKNKETDDGIELASGACRITIFAYTTLIIAIIADIVDLRRRRRKATSSSPSPPLMPFELPLRGLWIGLQNLQSYQFIYHGLVRLHAASLKNNRCREWWMLVSYRTKPKMCIIYFGPSVNKTNHCCGLDNHRFIFSATQL